MPIRAIFFDAGNTLIFLDPDTVLPVLRAHGAQVDLARFREAEVAARQRLAERVQDGATGTEAELWRGYFADLFRGSGVPEEKLGPVGERLKEIHEADHLWTRVEPDTVPALEELRRRGYRMAVISNADGRVEGLLKGAGLREFFEFVLDSEVEGVEKPAAEIFLRACRRMGVDPAESLYVGDLYPVDVVGARAAGLHAILVDPRGDSGRPVETIPSVGALPDFLRRASLG